MLENRCASLLRAARDIDEKAASQAEKRVHEFKASEYKRKIYKEAFHFYSSSFNHRLKAARDASKTPLADFRTLEFNSNGDEV